MNSGTAAQAAGAAIKNIPGGHTVGTAIETAGKLPNAVGTAAKGMGFQTGGKDAPTQDYADDDSSDDWSTHSSEDPYYSADDGEGGDHTYPPKPPTGTVVKSE
jgi:hypothetical protein